MYKYMYIYIYIYIYIWNYRPSSGHGLPDLLPPTTSLTFCSLPVPYMKQTYVIPPKTILPSTPRFSHGLLLLKRPPITLLGIRASSALTRWPAHCLSLQYITPIVHVNRINLTCLEISLFLAMTRLHQAMQCTELYSHKTKPGCMM